VLVVRLINFGGTVIPAARLVDTLVFRGAGVWLTVCGRAFRASTARSMLRRRAVLFLACKLFLPAVLLRVGGGCHCPGGKRQGSEKTDP
jgi:hypothetical protein